MPSPAQPTEKRSLTVAEFCSTYGIGRNTFYGELNSGRLQAVRVGRRVFIPRENADAWFTSLPSAFATKARAA